ncbi:ECF transporter S component [Schinkia azotoformans]|nr:ECF transporter S component [Schinkia azotoformans]MEC1639093.1 ECF transporter S component [Schinkia azotoformans]MEC1722324.1 ECF transporter S component [Schinkia azotoformans]MEC1945122.1 ECF transporter S component [Schinkia azotoformans]MED4354683.1 ECF transporter S component [Schinkia azotoformans]MED4414580.1 ECF transporter S component [Schinkia azotoformans]
MGRSRLLLIISTLLVVLLLFVMVLLEGDHYMLLSFLTLFVIMFPFFARFERKELDSRGIVLIAILAAIAAVSRVPFAAIPSVQPTSFVIIIAAIVFGAETGFLVGAIAALVSNLFLGQGPWTPWQMFSWGMMGLSAGLLKDWLWPRRRLLLLPFGFIWGFLFGWIMDLWYLVGFGENITLGMVVAGMVSSFYFDLAHALSNLFFLYVFSTRWKTILERFKVKYGLLGGACPHVAKIK